MIYGLLLFTLVVLAMAWVEYRYGKRARQERRRVERLEKEERDKAVESFLDCEPEHWACDCFAELGCAVEQRGTDSRPARRPEVGASFGGKTRKNPFELG